MLSLKNYINIWWNKRKDSRKEVSGGRMMKNSFQETKKSNFLYYGIILASVLVEVIMIWQLEKLIPLLYPGFIGFLVFHLLYHLLLFLVAKRSDRWDYLMIWGLFLMFNLLYDSFLGLLFLGLSFGMWCVFGKIPAITIVSTSLLARFFFYAKLVTHFSKLVPFSF